MPLAGDPRAFEVMGHSLGNEHKHCAKAAAPPMLVHHCPSASKPLRISVSGGTKGGNVLRCFCRLLVFSRSLEMELSKHK
jgi:hypothetical protein